MFMKQILVVEDDAFLVDIYKSRFEAEGMDAVFAADGEQAENLIENGLRPNLVILDILMPKKDGFHVLSHIRKHADLKDIPVLMATNLGHPVDLVKSKKLGATDHFVKSNTELSDIIDKVKKYLKA
jgi:two-component system response regulator VicR